MHSLFLMDVNKRITPIRQCTPNINKSKGVKYAKKKTGQNEFNMPKLDLSDRINTRRRRRSGQVKMGSDKKKIVQQKNRSNYNKAVINKQQAQTLLIKTH
ncbi:hypothetical protein R6Q57_000052 [Mikania cordata]